MNKWQRKKEMSRFKDMASYFKWKADRADTVTEQKVLMELHRDALRLNNENKCK